MKKRSKIFLLALCAVLLAASSVFGTLAYLTDQDQVENTFTVGNIKISLDETDVNEMGQPLNAQGGILKDGDTPAARVKTNAYKLIPGCTYTKDPTIHIGAGSEDAYLYVKLEIKDNQDLMELLKKHKLSTNLWNLLEGSKQAEWEALGDSKDDQDGNRTYLLSYHEIVKSEDTQDIKLFDSISVPAEFTKEDLALLGQFKIVITAYAVQAVTFDSAEAAWNATFGK